MRGLKWLIVYEGSSTQQDEGAIATFLPFQPEKTRDEGLHQDITHPS